MSRGLGHFILIAAAVLAGNAAFWLAAAVVAQAARAEPAVAGWWLVAAASLGAAVALGLVLLTAAAATHSRTRGGGIDPLAVATPEASVGDHAVPDGTAVLPVMEPDRGDSSPEAAVPPAAHAIISRSDNDAIDQLVDRAIDRARR